MVLRFFFLSFSCLLHHPLLSEVISSSLAARHRHWSAVLLLFPDINYVPVGRTLRRWTHRCVSLTSTKGGPGARLVIPRRGRRNPCVRSLRSYKVQFKKILSALLSSSSSSDLVTPSRLVSAFHFLVLSINRATVIVSFNVSRLASIFFALLD